MIIKDKDMDEILKYATNLCVNHEISVLNEYERQLALNPSKAVERTKQYVKKISSYDEDCYGL